MFLERVITRLLKEIVSTHAILQVIDADVFSYFFAIEVSGSKKTPNVLHKVRKCTKKTKILPPNDQKHLNTNELKISTYTTIVQKKRYFTYSVAIITSD